VDAKLIAQLEQLSGSLAHLAPALAVLYRRLVAEGVPGPDAATITGALAQGMVADVRTHLEERRRGR
jgi:hypothetical protein